MIDDDNNNDVNAFMMRGLVLRDRLLLSIFILVAANLLPFVLGIALRSEGYRPPDSYSDGFLSRTIMVTITESSTQFGIRLLCKALILCTKKSHGMELRSSFVGHSTAFKITYLTCDPSTCFIVCIDTFHSFFR